MFTASWDFFAALFTGEPLPRNLVGTTYLWMFPIYGLGGICYEYAHAWLSGGGGGVVSRIFPLSD